jgi:phage gpG-like protein
VPITGDFSALEQLEGQLEELASPAFRTELHRQLGEAARTLVALEFDSGKDPYGQPWAPLVAREGQPLRDTGRLANSWSAFGVGPSGFRIGTDVEYAAFHQEGTARIPRRQIIPEGDLPQSWERDFAAELEVALADLFRE